MINTQIAGHGPGICFPGLLVSVRNAVEAEAALEGGANWIDVKEPKRGALGPADPQTIRTVIETVSGRAPVSVAVGEFKELPSDQLLKQIVQPEAAAWKIGLAQCAADPDWAQQWQLLRDHKFLQMPPVAVVYADWKSAEAPSPGEILNEAVPSESPAVLIDTYYKSQGGLFDVWPEKDLERFIGEVRAAKMAIVLAGSLSGESIQRAAGLGPDLVAVRGAACLGGRSGSLSAARVAQILKRVRPNEPAAD